MSSARNAFNDSGRGPFSIALSAVLLIATSLSAHAGLVFGKRSDTPDQSNLVWQNLKQTQRAKDLYTEGKIQECRQLLTELGSKNSDLPPPDILLVWFLLADGKLNDAKIGLERIAASSPSLPHLYLTLGQIALSERRLADASVHFEKAATVALPTAWSEEAQIDFSVRVLESLSLVYEIQRRWGSAKATLEAVSNLIPAKNSVQVRLARCCLYMNEIEAAKNHLDKAVELGATPSAPLLLARLAYEAGNPDLVTDSLTEATEQQPDNPQALLWFAEWQLLCGNQSEAEELLALAIDNSAEPTSVGFIRGKISMLRQSYDKAAADFQMVLESQRESTNSVLDPIEIQCSLLLAKTAAIFTAPEKDPQLSEDLLAEAEKLALAESTRPLALSALAWNYLLQDRREEANAMLARAVQLARNGISSDQALLMAHFLATSEKEGDRKRAEAMLENLKARKFSEFLLQPLVTKMQSQLSKQ